MTRTRCLLLAASAATLVACSGGTSSPSELTPAAATQAPTPEPPLPTATPVPVVRHDIQATRLAIPSLEIDEPVLHSQVIPTTNDPPPGCPPYRYQSDDPTTVTVPEHGVATPAVAVEGVENKAWIYGHSRWLGVPNVFFRLQDIQIGDEVVLDGVDRDSGESYLNLSFHVTAIYLADVDGGTELLNAFTPDQIPTKPIVIMNTSARANGAGSPWILDRDKIVSRATDHFEGDINDPCKYLELWIIAE